MAKKTKSTQKISPKPKEVIEPQQETEESFEDISVQKNKSSRGKKADLELEIKAQEITEHGGYIHGAYATTEMARRIAEQTRYAIDQSKIKLFVDRLSNPSVINYLEALEHKAIQAERIANFKPVSAKTVKTTKKKK